MANVCPISFYKTNAHLGRYPYNGQNVNKMGTKEQTLWWCTQFWGITSRSWANNTKPWLQFPIHVPIASTKKSRQKEDWSTILGRVQRADCSDLMSSSVRKMGIVQLYTTWTSTLPKFRPLKNKKLGQTTPLQCPNLQPFLRKMEQVCLVILPLLTKYMTRLCINSTQSRTIGITIMCTIQTYRRH